MLDFSNQNITDDTIQITHARCLSISDITKYMGKQDQHITSLNLSDNKLTCVGAIQLLKYIINYAPYIAELNLARNNLDKNISGKLFSKFNRLLSQVLLKHSIKLVILTNGAYLSAANFIVNYEKIRLE